ncbi:FAD-dependent oxidoreductase [Mycolicibacter icosiumassiliensis]|uniref:FAD-dependent oxidoreductase n=1 Tax=Mycolicibacter icosiumassiliensis TaxID=1792835 RepID=UPI00082AB2FB|nr:FAD-dependent oxidoreductase [Mycolicibacter icosiumassiliensis]
MNNARYIPAPTSSRPKALIIGAGVSGLTSALVLARRGWSVTVASDRFGSDTVSTVAGALWEWPPSVCGRHHEQTTLTRSTDWAVHSYRYFAQLAANPHTGVSLRPAVFYFRRPIEEIPDEFDKMTQIEQRIPGFVHDAALIGAHGVNPDAGVVDAYSYLAPTVDTDRYLSWLTDAVVKAGASLIRHRVRGSLAQQEDFLLARHGAQVIINCAGLGGGELGDDTTMDPHRGALLRVINDGSTMPQITAAHAVAHDVGTHDQNMIFIVPRGADRLLLGGLVEPGQYDTALTWEGYPPLREMLERCTEFLPALHRARLDPADPLRVGLRPFRKDGVRLEAQPGTRILHNYGHGGAGVSLSWGCAEAVAEQAELVVAGEVVA